MPLKSYAVPVRFKPAMNALMVFSTGRIEQAFGSDEYKKDGEYYALAVGDFPNEDELTERMFDQATAAPEWLARQGLTCLHDGTVLKSRAESEETAVASMGLTRCVAKDTFDPASVEPYTPSPEEPLEED